MSKKLSKLQEQLANVQAEIAAEKKRLKEEERNKRLRRIEIIGGYYLAQAEKNGGLSQLAAALNKEGYLKNPSDRNLFGLKEPASTPATIKPDPAEANAE